MAIKILIDSASDINLEEAKEMGIELISMTINFGEDEFYDGVDLYPSQFYEKLIETDIIPTTSQINPFRWEEKFEEMTKDGDEIIAIVMSSKLSGTYYSACQAAEKFNGVYVLDSLSVAAGERVLCEYALRLIKEGLSAKEIFNKLDEEKKRINLIAVVNTLEYLKKGGRISSAVAFAGELLSIKPVLGVVDGEVKILGKAMGSKRSNNMLNTLVEKKGIDFSMPLSTLWSGLDKTMLDKYIKDSSALWAGKIDKLPEHIIGCTIGTHAGPGAFGFVFFEEN